MSIRTNVALVCALLVSSYYVSVAQADLLDCLTATNSTVVSPSSSTYDTLRAVANQRVSKQPAFITLPNTAQAVSDIVKCCRQFNVSAVPRSGGHSYEGYSVADGAVVVDVTQGFSFYEPQGDTTAWVGSGIRLGALYYYAWKDGNLSFPGGTCPNVGLAGLLLGGGWGMLGRLHGLACDQLLEYEMVNATGDLITVNQNTYPDLYWAAKGGGGGNFGIVTRFHLQMYPQPNTTTFINLAWPISQAVPVMQAWQAWAPTAPNEMTSNLQIGFGSVAMHGLYSGSQSDATAALQKSGLLSISGITTNTLTEQAFIESVLDFGQETIGISNSDPINLLLGPGAGGWALNSFKAGSYDVPTALDGDILSLMTQQVTQNSNSWFQFSAYGGQIGSAPADSSAYAGRYSLYNIQYSIGWPAGSDGTTSMAWFTQFQQAVSPKMASSAYVNYIDSSLPDWQTAYYGSNLQRLQTIKQKYDPTNYWSNPQTIPLP